MWVLIPLIALVLVVVLVVGIVTAVVAAAALVIGLVLRAVPFFLIAVAVWWLAKAIFGPGQARPYRGPMRPMPRARPAQRPAPRSTVQPRPAAARPSPARRRELPIDVQVKVEQIRSKADVLLGYADRFPPFSQDLYIVRQTTADYLPRTVNAYLAVPVATDPLLRASSTAALDELKAQLNLLDAKLDEIARDLQRHDLDQLLANRRFLEERFGMQEPRSEADGPRGVTGAA
jgi:hypothetical protein